MHKFVNVRKFTTLQRNNIVYLQHGGCNCFGQNDVTVIPCILDSGLKWIKSPVFWLHPNFDNFFFVEDEKKLVRKTKLQQKQKTHEICKTISNLTAKMYQNSAMEVGAFFWDTMHKDAVHNESWGCKTDV